MISQEATAPLIDELIAVLDEEIELLTTRSEQLDLLSEAIAGLDDKMLETLLNEIELAQQQQDDVDRRVQSIRVVLANHFEVRPQQMRLANLVDALTGPHRSAVDSRRKRIIMLAESLKQKNLQAATVLFECEKINRMLLECLFPTARSVMTYDSDGSATWRHGGGAVDSEL